MNTPASRFSLTSWTSIAGIVILGIIAAIYVLFFVENRERVSLTQRSATIAAAINLDDIRELTGTEADLSSSSYIRIKEKLTRIKEANPDIRFVYLTQKQAGQIKFLVDSESPSSADYSPPGQVYEEATPLFLSSFDTKKAFVEGPVGDRWGYWISSLSPIVDPETNLTIAMVGIDIDAGSYVANLIFYSLVPLFVTLFLIGTALSNRAVAARERENVHLRSEFIAIASHELRSPITGIKWILQQLYESGANFSDAQRGSIYAVIQNCQKLLFTVNDILDIAALEKGKLSLGEKSTVNLYSIMRDSIESQQFIASEKQITVILDGEWNTLGDEISCDKNRLKMALANIISNAIKYSPREAKVTVSLTRDIHSFTIHFEDSGIGIPEKDQAKIFKGFFRSQNAIHTTPVGTGLGLYYAKSIIEMHNGSISFDSKEGKGTTFHVTLPKA